MNSQVTPAAVNGRPQSRSSSYDHARAEREGGPPIAYYSHGTDEAIGNDGTAGVGAPGEDQRLHDYAAPQHHVNTGNSTTAGGGGGYYATPSQPPPDDDDDGVDYYYSGSHTGVAAGGSTAAAGTGTGTGSGTGAGGGYY